MSVAGDTDGSGCWAASGHLGVPNSSISPESAAYCFMPPGSSSHISVNKMVLEKTGFKPRAYFDLNL